MRLNAVRSERPHKPKKWSRVRTYLTESLVGQGALLLQLLLALLLERIEPPASSLKRKWKSIQSAPSVIFVRVSQGTQTRRLESWRASRAHTWPEQSAQSTHDSPGEPNGEYKKNADDYKDHHRMERH